MPLYGPLSERSFRYLPIDAAALGSNIVVPLSLLKKIRVLSYVLTAKDEVRATWTGLVTPLSGPMFIKEGAIVAVAGSPASPLFETLVSEPLLLSLSALTPVTGHITYVEV